MKKILLLVALLVATSAHAQSTRTQATANLMGLGMPGQLASEVAGLATGLGIQSGDLIFGATATIYQNTTDGADNRALSLSSGGSPNAGLRGAFVALNGNEQVGSPGAATIAAGSAAGADINVSATATDGEVILFTNGQNRWKVEADGDLTSQATNGGDLNLSSLGKTISIQESTPGSACSGFFTANGATPVVVSTTCAASTMRTLFTKTSTSAVNGSCYRSAISNGVSFTVTCLATDTGTYDWFIIKEAP